MITNYYKFILSVFMDLCNTNANEKITLDELYSVLKQNLFTHDDKVKLKGLLRKIYKEGDASGIG